MDIFDNVIAGFSSALSATKLMYCFFGVFMGMMMGVLPGIGAMATISMLLPVTFYVAPDVGLIMLAGIYYGAQYGGSISSILLNLPGTPSSAVICLDGYPMTKANRAGPAIFLTTMASFFGSMFAILLLFTVAPLAAKLALSFGASEYFALMILGLVAAASLAQHGIMRGLAMVVVGLMLGLVGSDVTSGTFRMTMGILDLADGFSIIAMAMGLFGVAEIMSNLAGTTGATMLTSKIKLRDLVPTRQDLRQFSAPAARGGIIGAILGILPGTGASIASFVSYGFEKRISRTPHKFGTGHVPGIVAPEAANNSAAQSAFIPTLTLGVPGDAVMALMMSALIIHGIQPGPTVITDHPDLFWGLVASFVIGNVILLILNLPLIGLWVRLLLIPYRFLYPVIIVLICVGVFSVGNSQFDVLQVIFFGFVGYGMKLVRLEPAPLVLGFVLGPLLEENFRRALILSRGDIAVFVEHPISASLLVACLAIILFSIRGEHARPKRENETPAPGDT
uniref:tripartite tricarboxylate transporter permease n=1 Tax=Pararhizobium sp. IMCC3301 TaxID=3067904 RepID=UPI0027423398|nr:tripartite tricarboxylate transporter permease [Pararhizobium sp. IMCC3301]